MRYPRYSIEEGPAAGWLAVSPDLSRLQCNMGAGPGDEDSLLTVWARAAAAIAEVECRRRIVPRTLVIRYDDFPSHANPLYIPAMPVRSITSIEYVAPADTPDGDPIPSVIDAADLFGRLDANPPYVLPTGTLSVWPSVAWPSAVTLTVEVGYTDPESIPESVSAGILGLVAWLERHREFTARDGSGASIPPAFRACCFAGAGGGLY
jgi:hypothetical protein